MMRSLTILFLALAASVYGQQAPDRSKAPVPGPPPSLTLPPIQKRALSNGLPVWVVESHEVPVANVTLVVKAGAADDPDGKYGLASFTAAMLDEGAGTRDALELADAIEFLGASISMPVSYDATLVRLQTPVSKLDAALALFADVVVRPTFPARELERVRKERLTSLLQTRDNPSALASAAFSRMIYGPRHRYGTSSMGNEASNGEMSVDDLRSFYAAHYQPRSAHVLVVGDVTADDVVARVERALGGWKNGSEAPRKALPEAPARTSRQIYLVDKPGAQQSQIRIGAVGVARNTADYYPLDVLNTILGGSFTSRLNQNLREEHGYAYGASSSFSMRISAGPFLASAGVQTDKTVESLREFFKELDGMHQPIPTGELERAKNLEALSFPAAFETTAGIANNLAELVIYGLPDSTYNDYVPRIQAVTAADVARVADAYIRTDRFAVVVVGDLSTIERPIREAGFGPVRVLTLDDVLK